MDAEPKNRGRPSKPIPISSIKDMLERNFTIPQMAKLLRVSTRTIKYRMREHGLSRSAQFSKMTDQQLDDKLSQLMEVSVYKGIRSMQAALLAEGIKVQMTRVQAALQRINSSPDSSEQHWMKKFPKYNTERNAAMWYIDGKELRYTDMATEGSQQVDTASASANTLSHEKCALCLKEFTSLRMLPCFHTFCLECLKNHLKIKQNADYFSCPLCKNTGYVPLSGIEELPISSDAEDEMTVFQNADAAHICDLCKNMEAKHKCLECNQFACDACTNIHAAITASRSHTVLHLSSIKSEVICSSPPLSGSCSKHSEEKLQLYCLHCSCIICRQCKLSSHENHSVADVSVIVTLARDMLLSFNKEINDYLRPMLETIFNEVATHKKNIPDKKLLLLTEVRHRAKEIIDATNSYLAEVEKQLDKETDRISIISNNIMEEMQKQLDTFQRFCEHVEHIMQVGCDADILELPNQIGEFFGMERIEVCPPSTWRQVNHIPNLKLFMDEKWRCAIDFSFSETSPRLIQCRAMTEHIRHYLGQVEKTNKTVPDPFQMIGSSVYGYQNCKPEVTISEIIQKIQKFLAAWKPRP